ncbi:MAG: hypothetical protein ACYTAN_10665 [Planctomycetota bacterium]|jgi:hypothetical protein
MKGANPYDLDKDPGAVIMIDEGAPDELSGDVARRTEVLFRDRYKVRVLAALRDTAGPPAPR